MAFSLINLSVSTFSFLDGRRVLGGREVVERGAELLGGEVGELVDALLPAGAAQVVAADLPQVLGEDPEAVRLLPGVLVDLFESELNSVQMCVDKESICICEVPCRTSSGRPRTLRGRCGWRPRGPAWRGGRRGGASSLRSVVGLIVSRIVQLNFKCYLHPRVTSVYLNRVSNPCVTFGGILHGVPPANPVGDRLRG